MSDQRSPAIDKVMEQVGSWFASLGVPRAAGQMFGYLLVCEPAEQSAGEIIAHAGLSPASVSASARLLVQMDAVERRHRVGDRKTYYRLRSDFWIAMAKAKLQGFGHLAAMGRHIVQAEGLPRTDGLDEMIDLRRLLDR